MNKLIITLAIIFAGCFAPTTKQQLAEQAISKYLDTVPGYGGGSFSPLTTVTRADFCQRYLNAVNGQYKVAISDIKFFAINAAIADPTGDVLVYHLSERDRLIKLSDSLAAEVDNPYNQSLVHHYTIVHVYACQSPDGRSVVMQNTFMLTPSMEILP